MSYDMVLSMTHKATIISLRLVNEHQFPPFLLIFLLSSNTGVLRCPVPIPTSTFSSSCSLCLSPSLLVFYGFCKKLPQRLWHKTTYKYLLQSPGQKFKICFTGLKSMCKERPDPSESLGRESIPCFFLLLVGLEILSVPWPLSHGLLPWFLLA